MSCLGTTAETTHLHVLFQALMTSFASLLAAYGDVPPEYVRDIVDEAKVRRLQTAMRQWARGFKADRHCSDKLSLDHVLVRSPDKAAEHARELAAVTGDLEILKGLVSSRALDATSNVDRAEAIVEKVEATVRKMGL